MTQILPRERPALASADMDFAHHCLAQMMYTRAFEAKAWSLSQVNPPRVMGSMHFCAGQEAVPVGAVAGLRADDQLMATYRGHGWALASGLDPQAVMAEICHRAEGINGGRGGSAYLMAPHTRFIGENSIVGAGTTMACGIATANLTQANGRVVVVSIGDGAMNQGAVHEAMAFASVRKLPIVFVVENNGWSELTATSDMFLIDRLAGIRLRHAIGHHRRHGSGCGARQHCRGSQKGARWRWPEPDRMPRAAPLGPLQP
jgi:2-oxoisovalerate dehydrogenase E1 component